MCCLTKSPLPALDLTKRMIIAMWSRRTIPMSGSFLVTRRLDNEDFIHAMNYIYSNYWSPLQNFFQASFKLKEKVRVGGRIKKKYDPPKTPYQRLMESPYLSKEQKDALAETKRKLNPFELKKGLDKHLEIFEKAFNEYEKHKKEDS